VEYVPLTTASSHRLREGGPGIAAVRHDPREVRTQRRAAECKAKKLESKKAKLEAAAAPAHFSPTSAGFV